MVVSCVSPDSADFPNLRNRFRINPVFLDFKTDNCGPPHESSPVLTPPRILFDHGITFHAVDDILGDSDTEEEQGKKKSRNDQPGHVCCNHLLSPELSNLHIDHAFHDDDTDGHHDDGQYNHQVTHGFSEKGFQKIWVI